MTESEWLSSVDPAAMLNLGTEYPGMVQSGKATLIRVSDRKLRLFACAVAEDLYAISDSGHQREWIDFAYVVADELPCKRPGHNSPYWVNHESAFNAAHEAVQSFSGCNPEGLPKKTAGCNLLREIVGNPFRPVRCKVTGNPLGTDTVGPNGGCDCRWITPTVLSIAKRIYDHREFEPADMAALHDALVEAGCDEEEMLRHLRGQERHFDAQHNTECGTEYRGCAPQCRFAALDNPDESIIGQYVCEACGNQFQRRVESGVKCDSCGSDYARKLRRSDLVKIEPSYRPLRTEHCRGCWVIDLILGKE